jgi:hypothetical protein
VFKLTVTDAKGLTGTDMVSVNVKRGMYNNDPNNRRSFYYIIFGF